MLYYSICFTILFIIINIKLFNVVFKLYKVYMILKFNIHIIIGSAVDLMLIKILNIISNYWFLYLEIKVVITRFIITVHFHNC